MADANPQKFTNWRLNPFSGVSNPVPLEEIHVVKYMSESNLYGIQATEGIVLEDPSSVTLHFRDEDPDNLGQYLETALVEVLKSVEPSSGEYRVDYDSDGFLSTSIIELNASDLDREVILRYKGTGSIVKSEYIFRQQSVIPTNLSVEGALYIPDIDPLDPSLEASKLLRDLRVIYSRQNVILNSGNHDQFADIFESRTTFKNQDLIETSQTWIKPANVNRIDIIMCGGGGGSGATIIGYLDVIADINIVIGAGGSGGIINLGIPVGATSIGTFIAGGGEGGSSAYGSGGRDGSPGKKGGGGSSALDIYSIGFDGGSGFVIIRY
jgi:hypothetical protein